MFAKKPSNARANYNDDDDDDDDDGGICSRGSGLASYHRLLAMIKKF